MRGLGTIIRGMNLFTSAPQPRRDPLDDMGATMKRWWLWIGLPPRPSAESVTRYAPDGQSSPTRNSNEASQAQPSTEHWSGVSCQRADRPDSSTVEGPRRPANCL